MASEGPTGHELLHLALHGGKHCVSGDGIRLDDITVRDIRVAMQPVEAFKEGDQILSWFLFSVMKMNTVSKVTPLTRKLGRQVPLNGCFNHDLGMSGFLMSALIFSQV